MFHKNALPDDIHVIHNWEVADSAALAALVVTADDIGKVARKLDDNSFHILLDEAPVTWGFLGGSIADAGSYFPDNNVEAALQYIGERLKQIIPLACSDETTALTAGNDKVVFRMPAAMTLTAVRASLTTAQTSGAVFSVNIRAAGVSILSTLITIDNGEKSSVTAITAPVISTAALADDAEISIDISQVGDGTAKGLKVYLIGRLS